MPKYKIAIGLTAGADQRVHWVGLISALQAMSKRDWSDYEFEIISQAGLYISLNRQDIAEAFMKSDSDYLLYLDHDNGFFPDAFDLFMEDFENPEVNIVSGLYYLKTPGTRIYVAGQKPHNEKIFRCDHYPEEAFVKKGLLNISKDFGGAGGLVGTGILMLRRSVFKKMKYPFFDSRFHNALTEDGAPSKIWYFLGEDNYFCMKAQEEAGFDIYLDTRIRSPHMQGDTCFPDEWKQYKGAAKWSL
jgi:hypothetical protein